MENSEDNMHLFLELKGLNSGQVFVHTKDVN